MATMQPEQRGILRPMQPDGHYVPISSCFPAVKQPNTAGNEACMLHKRPSALQQQENQPKRVKMLGGSGSKGGSQAVDELLGRQGIAGTNQEDASSIGLPFSHMSSREPLTRDAKAAAGASAASGITTFLDITQTKDRGEVEDSTALLKHLKLKGTFPVLLMQMLEAHKTSLLSMRLPSNALGRPPLPPGATETHNSNGTHTSGNQPQAAAQQPEVLVQQCLPYDWALKASARFSTAGRFACFDISSTASIKHDTCCPRHTWAGLPIQERWLLSLISWQYPADGSMTPSSIAAVQSAVPELLARRLDGWRVALSSAYMAVRHRQCPALYVDSAQGTRHPYTLLFTAAGIRGCSQPQALLTCSSVQQRSRMHAAGLQFSMPLAPQHLPQQQQQQPALPAERTASGKDADAETPAPAAVQHVKDNSPQSLLLCQGPVQVHMLFDWLLQEVDFSVQQGGDTADVPRLLAPVPFKNACCHRPDVKSMYGMVGNLACEAQQQQQQHVLEVAGPLPPWTMTRMCAALAEAAIPHQQSFQVDFVTQAHSLALNVWPSSGAGSTLLANSAAGWELAPEEGKAACDAPQYLSQRVMHRVVAEPAGQTEHGAVGCMRTLYHIRLSG